MIKLTSSALILTCSLLFPAILHAQVYEGVYIGSGAVVGIEALGSNRTISPGSEVEIIDYDTGNVTSATVEYIDPIHNGHIEIEVYDFETESYKIIEVDQ